MRRKSVIAVLDRRISNMEEEVTRVKGDQRRLTDSVSSLKRAVDANNAMLVHSNEMMVEVHGWLANLKGFWTTVKWIGKIGRVVLLYIILPIATIYGGGYAIFHHGRFPEWWVQLVRFLFG